MIIAVAMLTSASKHGIRSNHSNDKQRSDYHLHD